jgi:hypothetical protein
MTTNRTASIRSHTSRSAPAPLVLDTPRNRTVSIIDETAPQPRPGGQTPKDRLIAWRSANPEISNAQIARFLGYSPAYVSIYLAKPASEFPGDIAKFEMAVLDFLRGRALKQSFEFPVISTEVSESVSSFADYVRGCGGIGVLHGDAGLGKSVGLALFAEASKTGILITANANQRDAHGIKQLLWPHASHGYRQNGNRWEHICAVLRGTNRLIMVDNAQRLLGDGRHALCDLLDQTGCPILLAGNPNILAKIASDDQQFSRALPALPVSLKDPSPVVSHILGCLIPEHAETLHAPACDVASRKGHLRQMVNQVKATIALSQSPGFRGKTILSAWASARALSIDTKAV